MTCSIKTLILSYKQSVYGENVFTFKINNTLKIFNATDLTLSRPTGFIVKILIKFILVNPNVINCDEIYVFIHIPNNHLISFIDYKI